MEQDDDGEFEQLLGEIPRATSAPPHLEELQKAYGGQLDDPLLLMRPDESPVVNPNFDIRSDELYDTFYRSYSGTKKLPPPLPLEDTRRAEASSGLSPKAMATQLSPFFSGLDLDSPRFGPLAGRQHLGQHGLGHQQQGPPIPQHYHHQSSHHQRRHSQEQLHSDQVPSHGHRRHASQGYLDRDLSLASSFGGLSMEDGTSSRSGNGSAEAITPGGGASPAHEDFSRENRLQLQHMRRSYDAANGGSLGLDGGYSQNGMEGFSKNGGTGLNSFGSASSLDGYISRSSLGNLDGLSKRAPSADHPFAQRSSSVESFQGGNPQVLEQLLRTRSSPVYDTSQLNGVYSRSGKVGSNLEGYPGSGNLDAYTRTLHNSNGGLDLYSNTPSQQSQGYLSEYDVAAFLQTQQQMQKAVLQTQRLQQQMEEERLRHRLQQQQLLLQQQALAAAAVQQQRFHQSQMEVAAAAGMPYARSYSPPHRMPSPQHHSLHHPPLHKTRSSDAGWATLERAGSICKYYLQGYCSRGDGCPFVHAEPKGPVKDQRGPLPPAREEPRYRYGEKGIPRPASRERLVGNGHHSAHHSEHHLKPSAAAHPPLAKYTSLAEVEGKIYQIAKDQHGCRFLQKQFDEGGPAEVEKIFREIIGHIVELMTDPFGNYLIQKLLECCNQEQRQQVLDKVVLAKELVTISLNMHGTRAVQKLIETISGPDQVRLVVSGLKPGVVTLIKDLNGNHVIQRCLQRLSNDDNQFIFDAAAAHCVEVATHRHGCCVLQRCVDFAGGAQRQRLVAEIAANALVLSQDPFGNYVVQYILDLGLPWASTEVMTRLEGNYPYLATQKFSSNVVEKCLKLASEDSRNRIVRELMLSPRLGHLLQDPYANYVVQSALTVSKGNVHAGLVDAIRPHLTAVRNSPYGKRILSQANLKLGRGDEGPEVDVRR